MQKCPTITLYCISLFEKSPEQPAVWGIIYFNWLLPASAWLLGRVTHVGLLSDDLLASVMKTSVIL